MITGECYGTHKNKDGKVSGKIIVSDYDTGKTIYRENKFYDNCSLFWDMFTKLYENNSRFQWESKNTIDYGGTEGICECNLYGIDTKGLQDVELKVVNQPVTVKFKCADCSKINEFDYNFFYKFYGKPKDWRRKKIKCKYCGSDFMIDLPKMTKEEIHDIADEFGKDEILDVTADSAKDLQEIIKQGNKDNLKEGIKDIELCLEMVKYLFDEE